ncbi:SHOCT domain-containing protein [Granulosicoccus antarcticus]|uniref:SHOCT domain-containing protein n=1 Tax=Granulosicoccus antarcticus IMCC3135 TaxID=1192854 RepID=A0A2Z2NU88_9GAMM|nr:SHOCT domain-containing protein [Granulosicoccus antarcticus]ASJ71217.1 hypothetical protein IMCC3135_05525 [Granulosicoccus antarcticus IMCC3135]
MQNLSSQGRNAVTDIARRYNISTGAVEHMLIAVNNGSGSMAQFNCPELGGSGQWMRGGMTMVGDMFNNGLKATVDNLCNELSNLLATTQVFPETSSSSSNGQWWPDGLGSPNSSGSQNNSRYAVFNNRLAVDVNGNVTVYDTLDHQVGGVSQQQGGDNSLTFSSQYGTISVSSLPIVSGANTSSQPNANFASTQAPVETNAPFQNNQTENETSQNNSASNNSSDFSGTGTSTAQSKNGVQSNEIIALLEKLAQLHDAGVLSDEEFGTKKQELLARL